MIRKITKYVFIKGKCSNREVPNMDELRKHLLREGHLNKPEVVEILKEVIKIMSM